MFGDSGTNGSKETALSITQAAIESSLFCSLVEDLSLLDFEARKDAVQIFGGMVRIEGPNPGQFPGRDFLEQTPRLIDVLFDNYTDRDPELALDCGNMIRSCIRDEVIAESILRDDEIFWELFPKLELQNFEIASDAFITFKDLLTRHKNAVANFLRPVDTDQEGTEDELEDNYSLFFKNYEKLLLSPNHVTRRQSVKFLGELLCDKHNLFIMKKYVSSVEDLKVVMGLLRDTSKLIQFEAFHVFKIFVANPKKSPGVQLLLYSNKDKLLRYLEEFQMERDDEQFVKEKSVIIETISMLTPPEHYSDQQMT